MDICDLAPGYIRAIAPYQPGKPISELARELGLDEAGIIKLASNENPLGVSPLAQRAIEASLAGLARYPDGNGFELKQALSRRHGVGRIASFSQRLDACWRGGARVLAPGLKPYIAQRSPFYPWRSVGRRAGIRSGEDYVHYLARLLRAVTTQTRLRLAIPTPTERGSGRERDSSPRPREVRLSGQAYKRYRERRLSPTASVA